MDDISYQTTSVLVGSEAVDARIVFAQGRLIAVMTRLSGAHYEHLNGCWYLEAGFGPCAEMGPDPFDTLDDADSWIDETVHATPRIS